MRFFAAGLCLAARLFAQRELVQQYCAPCHSGKTASGGVDLASADALHPSMNAALWEKAIRKVRAGSMPPQGAPRPERAALDRFASALEGSIDAAAKPTPVKSGLRRLNRAEYGSAIRDLLDLKVDVTALLPADDANRGFDNNAASLGISPALLDGYLAASRQVSRLAVGDPAVPSAFRTYSVRPDAGQDEHVDGLPLGTRGGLLVEHYFPLSATYELKPRLALNTSAKVRGLDYPHRAIVTLDGVKIHEAIVGGPADVDAAALSPPESEKDILARLAFLTPITAGAHRVGVTFVRKTGAVPDGYLQPWLRSNFDTQEQRGVPLVESLAIGGPFDAAGGGDTPSRRKIFLCDPSRAERRIDEDACAKKILVALARRAWREVPDSADLKTLLHLYREGRANATFEAGIESGLRFLLASPAFIFRSEAGDAALASRLSFFIWGSLPDEELLMAANSGKLKDSAVLAKQVKRMMADPRSESLSANFAAQWLYLRNLTSATRDLKEFPWFDDDLRQGFRQETERFFDSIVREDRGAVELLSADYTFVNERLARHYGIPGVNGSYFRRVKIPGEERRGLLGQGSILTVTSYATRTSPVLRGKWLVENILGTPIPPPPPDIPPLAENLSGARPRSVRERMEQHRANPSCAVCHNIMDPIGFALENFDATGAWRSRTENNAPVDASGVLVDGTHVDGPVALRNALLSRPETFVQTFTEKLFTYALGRGIDYADMPAIRRVVREAAGDNYRISALLTGIARSAPFQEKSQ